MNTELPFFDIKQKCNTINENKIYRFWHYDSRYDIKDFANKMIFIFMLIAGISILSWLACRSLKDILYELK